MVSVLPQTTLLLTASGFSGSLGNTATSTAGTFAIVPTLEPPQPPAAAPASIVGRSLFAYNNRVYYKPNSLASGGIGGVRNHRRKARRT